MDFVQVQRKTRTRDWEEKQGTEESELLNY